MEIRRAEVEDAAKLAEQMKTVVDEDRWLATESDRTIEQLTATFRAGLEEGHILFVLEDDSRVVGAIGVHPSGTAGVLDLGMSILAEHRGKGWGRKLLDAALVAAAAEGARKITVEVFPDNGRAIALYAAAGFEVEGLKRNQYLREDGSLRSALMMARFLG